MHGMQMPGMDMSQMNGAESYLMKLASGTAVNPASWDMPMLMQRLGSWNTSFMAQAFLVDTQQSGPRGGDKFYSTNWLMANAEHAVGARGALQFTAMMSLEPATVTERRYPLLFQTGETAFGKPIVDGQHPHNLFTALSVQYAYAATEHTTLYLYAAPVGEPALGPVAYPHRASAKEIPQAPLSHHWQDSTHISDDVVTAGLSYKSVRLEASGFHGAEPNENRWNIAVGPVDSWSTRLWFLPGEHWAAQVSVGRLTHPEASEPGDQVRSTASLAYTKQVSGRDWSSTIIWGRNHYIATGRNSNSYLAESVVPLGHNNFITGRAELVDKDELFANQPILQSSLAQNFGDTFRIGGYRIGYTRDFPIFEHIETGLGFNFDLYTTPAAVKPYYRDHPVGGNIFVRFRLKPIS
jgi:hypothetical protein